jgi:hypothetical protein
MGTDLASTLDSCYRRSKSMFGTSKVWPETYNATNGGILETDPAHSRFANWTKIVIMYCDGSFHQGNNKNSIKYKDTELYFRGALNTRSHIKWAHDKYDLTKASKIVVSGSSAGGMATYLCPTPALSMELPIRGSSTIHWSIISCQCRTMCSSWRTCSSMQRESPWDWKLSKMPILPTRTPYKSFSLYRTSMRDHQISSALLCWKQMKYGNASSSNSPMPP